MMQPAGAPPSFLDIPGRLTNPIDVFRLLLWQFSCDFKVAAPGIIQSFDPIKQSASVQIAIRENMLQDLKKVPTTIQPIADVPVLCLGGGGLVVTFPIESGDECLLIFTDNSFDSWWQSSGVQNQWARRRHNITDAVAIVGLRSLPNSIKNYSTTAMELRTEDGTSKISVSEAGVQITSPLVTVNGNLTVNGTLSSPGISSIDSTHVSIAGKDFLTHLHSGVTTGAGSSGPVVP